MNQRKIALRIGMCLSFVAFSALIVFAGVKVIPKNVKYTVKSTYHSPSDSQYSNNTSPTEYTFKSLGNKICVLVDGSVMFEISVNADSLSEYDRRRLKDGITVSGEGELMTLKEHLES